ncbi:MAG: hypothetical protein ACKVHE_26550 [Planctomycetales bacterium]
MLQNWERTFKVGENQVILAQAGSQQTLDATFEFELGARPHLRGPKTLRGHDGAREFPKARRGASDW